VPLHVSNIVLIFRRSKLYYTASGIITHVGGRPVHRLREDCLNLCTGRQFQNCGIEVSCRVMAQRRERNEFPVFAFLEASHVKLYFIPKYSVWLDYTWMLFTDVLLVSRSVVISETWRAPQQKTFARLWLNPQNGWGPRFSKRISWYFCDFS